MSQPKLKARIVLSMLVALVLLASILGVIASGRLKQARAATDVTISEFPLPYSEPFSITSGSDGNLWFTDGLNNNIGRVTPQGVITEFSIPPSSSVKCPYGIATGPDGNVWFTERCDNKIGRITPNGTITEYQLPTNNSAPLDITSGSDGNLWFAEDAGGRIGRITPQGVITEFPDPDHYPVSITSGSDGNLWFAEGMGSIGRITPQGVITMFPGPSIPGHYPSSITSGPDGALWFTEYDSGNIGRITLNGTITEFSVPTATSKPNGITTGPDGNIWFTEIGTSQIGRVTPSGTITEFSVPTHSSMPWGITTGADGNLWFTEFHVGKIGRVNLTSVATPTPSPTMSPTAIPTVAPTQTPAPQRQKLFVMVQGITTALSSAEAAARKGDGQDQTFFGNGKIAPFLMSNGYQNARFLDFSYTGFDHGNGKPRPYTCLNTFTNPLITDIQLLGLQIQAALKANPNTDVYIGSHSQGGLIAYGYMAALVENTGIVAPLPSGAALKAVFTLDSPLGGVSDNPDYSIQTLSFFEAHCKGVSTVSYERTVYSMFDLFRTGKAGTRGSTASIVQAILKKGYISNQRVAEDAKKKGIAVLTVGNMNDLFWRPSKCNADTGLHMKDFLSTQWVTDEGNNSDVYGRNFASGVVNHCLIAMTNFFNHGDVLSNNGVEQALLQFLPNGGTPTKLAVAPKKDTL